MVLLSYHPVRLRLGALLFSMTIFGLVIRIFLATNVNPSFVRENPFEWVATDWVWPAAMALAAATVGRLLYLGVGDCAALKSLPEGLQVTSFFSRKTIPWDQLLGGHRVNYGNFVHRNRWFNVRYMKDGAYGAMRIPLILTKRPLGGQQSLPDKIEQARAQALNQPYTPGGERIEGTGIDHDAAIARYLKNKAAAEAAAPAGPRLAGSALAGPAPAGPGAQPAASAPAPARPAFGRKGLG